MMTINTFSAVALAAATSTAALAQSTVTLAGVADAAARQVSNDGSGSIRSLVSGSNSTSRLVFRGSEDLGQGLSGSFHLEHGLALDTGTVINNFWDRRATVSLTSRAAGELRLGRDFVPSYTAWSRYDPFGYVGVAGSNNFVSATPLGPIRSAYGTGANSTVRSSNSIQVLLPAGIGGVEGGLMVAAGENGIAANGQHKVVGGRIGWAGGPVGFTVARTKSTNDLTLVSGGFNDTTVGGTVNFAPLRANLAWRQFKQNQAKQTNLMGAVVLTLGSSEVKASYVEADLAGRVGTTVIDNNDASQVGLGYVYNLSRRTALYATAARIDNQGAATFVVPGGPALAAGRSSSGYEAGVRHIF